MNAFGRLLARQPLIAPSLLRAPLLRAAPLQVACLASRVAVARQVPAVSRLLLRMQLDGSANLLQRRVRAEEPEQIEQARAFASSAQRPAPQNTKSSARYFLFLVAGLVAAGLAYYSFGASRLPAQPVEPELSPELAMAAEEVTKRLRLKETVSPINAGSVVSKYEMNYIPSNGGCMYCWLAPVTFQLMRLIDRPLRGPP